MILKRLKVPKVFIGVARTFPTHETQAYWCWKRGRNLKIAAKRDDFYISSGKNQILPILATVEKSLEKYCFPLETFFI